MTKTNALSRDDPRSQRVWRIIFKFRIQRRFERERWKPVYRWRTDTRIAVAPNDYAARQHIVDWCQREAALKSLKIEVIIVDISECRHKGGGNHDPA